MIKIKDSNLEDKICQSLNYKIITEKIALNLTSLSAENKNIKDLNGLEHFIKLRKLYKELPRKPRMLASGMNW